jgi:hypothetical protein
MERKDQESYERLLRAIEETAASWSVPNAPDPQTIVVDFEAAAISAAKHVFGEEVDVRGCFYHLTQSTWRKVQELGLASTYRTDEAFRLFCGMLDGLAFLPVADVENGLQWLQTVTPSNATQLLTYFDETYVSGVTRQLPTGPHGQSRVRRTPARFAPALWNVHSTTLDDGSRTNNVAEGWNNRLRNLVGHYHPSIWRLIEALQADSAEASAAVLKQAVGNLPPKPASRAAVAHHKRLRRLCDEYVAGDRLLADFLRAVGHSIRFVCH